MKTTRKAIEKQMAIINNNFLSSFLSLNAEYAAMESDDPVKLKTRNSGIKPIISIIFPPNPHSTFDRVHLLWLTVEHVLISF